MWHENGWLQCKPVRTRWKLSFPASWPLPSVPGSASMFGCSSIYWISGHAFSVQYSPLGLAQTLSSYVFPNYISGLVNWRNDSCEEFSIPERSGKNVIHRLAATLHKACCWNIGYNLSVSLRKSSAPAPCQGLAPVGVGGGILHR